MDFNPQSNLTTCFGAEDVEVSIGDLMMNVIEDEELPEREKYIWKRNGVDFIRTISTVGRTLCGRRCGASGGMISGS